ncbi:hypothetical protein ACFX1R_028579 [Malus domestica]
MVVDLATTEKIKQTISEAKDEVEGLVSKARSKQLEAEPGRTLVDSFENKVNQVLNRARDKAGSSAEKSLSEVNNLKAMVTAGSKRNFIKMSHMIACVGQLNIEGKRTPYGLIDHPPLPHLTEDDYGPECRGKGLTDTVVTTYEIGYIQRRLVHALEDIMVQYDGTICNSLGDVIQFVYGEDRMDAAWISELLENVTMLSKQKLKDLKQTNHNLAERLEAYMVIPSCFLLT